ncbi:MAG: ClpX C4-type zinc finger protein [Phycisphaerales bacterium JB043]
MHDKTAQGNDFFKCDFCLSPWDDANPMVEGHRGSLICSRCLRVAYTQLVTHNSPDATTTDSCTLCLEAREQPVWISPLTEANACLRCVKLSSRALERDEDSHWERPASETGSQDATS